MTDPFQQYQPLSNETKKTIWEEGLIVLDANVLLNLYQLPEPERDEVIMVFNHAPILKRIWIPHQVAEEFYRNRLRVIHEQIIAGNKLRDEVDQLVQSMQKSNSENLANFQNSNPFKNFRKHHPIINKEDWDQKLSECLTQLNAPLDKVAQELRDEYELARTNSPVSLKADPLLEMIRSILEERTGELFSDEEYTKHKEEAQRRIDNRIPPGYEDRKKHGNSPFGDYFVWVQILAKAGGENKHTVFVSNDLKKDWVQKVGGENIGPQPQLRREYYDQSGKEIEFTSLSRFTQWACDTYNLDIEDQIALDEAIQETSNLYLGTGVRNKRILRDKLIAEGVFEKNDVDNGAKLIRVWESVPGTEKKKPGTAQNAFLVVENNQLRILGEKSCVTADSFKVIPTCTGHCSKCSVLFACGGDHFHIQTKSAEGERDFLVHCREGKNLKCTAHATEMLEELVEVDATDEDSE